MLSWRNLLSVERLGGTITETYFERVHGRSETEKDYYSIVTSASFRRLQDKTQVFPLEQSDFVRTRLTHSVEATSYAKMLSDAAVDVILSREFPENFSLPETTRDETLDYYDTITNIPEIVACAGLLHDIGNPPFGHFGETVIREWFKKNLTNTAINFCGSTLQECIGDDLKQDFLNFEGNAQAFRLITKLHFSDSAFGMNLTDAVLNTLVKYPTKSSEVNKNHPDIKFHKMGFFKSDENNFNSVARRTGVFMPENNSYVRHPLTFLLEAADDIAYSTADLEDGFKKSMFTINQLKDFLMERFRFYGDQQRMNYYQSNLTYSVLTNDLNHNNAPQYCDVDMYAVQQWLKSVRSWFAHSAIYRFETDYDEIKRGTYQKDLLSGTNHEYTMKIIKDVMAEFIFPARKILKLEIAAETILGSLLDKFVPAILYFDYNGPAGEDGQYRQSKVHKKLTKLLSENYIANYRRETENITDEREKIYYKLLLVTDFICGMTDSYAKTLYQELNGIY